MRTSAWRLLAFDRRGLRRPPATAPRRRTRKCRAAEATPVTPDATSREGLRPVYRITTFVPPESLDAVLEGVLAHTPLRFGPYDASAWWSAPGTEQYRPREGSTPTVGSVGVTERVPTVRLEFAIPRDPALLARVIHHGLIPNHPWQEPAVFVDESMASATELAG